MRRTIIIMQTTHILAKELLANGKWKRAVGCPKMQNDGGTGDPGCD